ncbi:MAG: proprotein convertase P-domain-containing protein, partial [Flavobacteriaceae bacterium]
MTATSGSSVENFTVQLNLFDPQLNAPTPLGPLDEATDIGLSPTLVWQEDTNADAYFIEVATNADFNSPVIAQDVLAPRFVLTDLTADATYFWRVRSSNPCTTSAFSEIQQFDTVAINCLSFTSDNLPLALNDASSVGDGVTLASVFVEQSNLVESLTVKVRITHPYVSDLILYLLAPNGQRIKLSGELGGSGDNYTDTVFDQNATESILNASPPFTGTFRPIESFDVFRGINAMGEWKLRIVDVYTQDTGELLDFQLQLCVQGALETNVDQDLFVDSLDNCPFVFNNNQEDFDGDGV